MKGINQKDYVAYVQNAVSTIQGKNKPLDPATLMSDGMIECLNGEEIYVISGAEAVAAFWDLTSKIQSHPEWRGKFSKKYISTCLTRILAGLSSRDVASLTPGLVQFVDHLRGFSEVREIVMPIQGLTLEVEAFELGRVVFRPADQREMANLKEKVSQTIQTLRYSPADRGNLLAHVQRVIDDRLGMFGALAFSQTVAEITQARFNAIQEVDMALSVLRFLTPYSQDIPELVNLGLPGQFAAAAYSSIAFSEDGSFNTDFSEAGRHIPFMIDDQFLRRHGGILTKLSGIIVNTSRTELEDRILAAIKWAGRAQTDSLPQQQVLSLMTALECLLNPTDGKPLRVGVSENAVLLVGSEDLEKRLKLYDFLGQMYNTRSSIIHGGSAEASRSDISNLQQVVGAVIKRVIEIKHKYNTRKALEASLERARLSAKADV